VTRCPRTRADGTMKLYLPFASVCAERPSVAMPTLAPRTGKDAAVT
jgi:hypothetical protein